MSFNIGTFFQLYYYYLFKIMNISRSISQWWYKVIRILYKMKVAWICNTKYKYQRTTIFLYDRMNLTAIDKFYTLQIRCEGINRWIDTWTSLNPNLLFFHFFNTPTNTVVSSRDTLLSLTSINLFRTAIVHHRSLKNHDRCLRRAIPDNLLTRSRWNNNSAFIIAVSLCKQLSSPLWF